MGPDRQAVLLAVLFLLAGCNTLTGEQTPTLTVTPASVPTDDPAGDPVSTFVAGVGESGTVDPVVLAERHREALSTHSYVFTFRRTVSNGTDTHRETYVRSWAAPNRSAYRLVQYVNESRADRVTTTGGPAVDLWYNGSTAFFRVTDSTGTPYIRDDQITRSALTDPTFAALLGETLSAGRYRGEHHPDESLTLVAVAIGNRSAIDLGPTEPIRNASLTATVTPAGIVRATRLAYSVQRSGDWIRVRQTTRVRRLDNTTVPVPDWAPGDSAR